MFRVEFSSILRVSNFFVDLVHLAEKALCDVRNGSRDQESPTRKGEFCDTPPRYP